MYWSPLFTFLEGLPVPLKVVLGFSPLCITKLYKSFALCPVLEAPFIAVALPCVTPATPTAVAGTPTIAPTPDASKTNPPDPNAAEPIVSTVPAIVDIACPNTSPDLCAIGCLLVELFFKISKVTSERAASPAPLINSLPTCPTFALFY